MESLPPRIADAIAELKLRLAARFGDRLRSFVLFGSWAWGRPHSESDIDLCVVIDGATHSDHTAVLDDAAGVSIARAVDLSPVVWSSEQFRRGLDTEHRIVLDIASMGIPL